MIIRDDQPRYTPKQADVIADIHGYENGDDYMTDEGYYCCGNCGDYVAEPGGYDDKTATVLCDRCAA